MDKNRFYIKPLGSVCYDDTGLTYPEDLLIDLTKVVKMCEGFNIKWECQFNWDNQPKVIVFDILTTEGLDKINDFIYSLGLMTVEYWTRERQSVGLVW